MRSSVVCPSRQKKIHHSPSSPTDVGNRPVFEGPWLSDECADHLTLKSRLMPDAAYCGYTAAIGQTNGMQYQAMTTIATQEKN